MQYVIFCIGDAHDKGKQTRYHNHHYYPHQQENLTWLKTLCSFQIVRFCLKHPVECVESVVVNRKHHQLIWSQKIPCRDQDILTSQSLGSLFIMNSAPSNSSSCIWRYVQSPSPKPQVFCPHAYGQISDNMACSLDSGVLGFLLSVLHFVWFCLVLGRTAPCPEHIWNLVREAISALFPCVSSPHSDWSILSPGKCKKQQKASFKCHFPFIIIFFILRKLVATFYPRWKTSYPHFYF